MKHVLSVLCLLSCLLLTGCTAGYTKEDAEGLYYYADEDMPSSVFVYYTGNALYSINVMYHHKEDGSDTYDKLQYHENYEMLEPNIYQAENSQIVFLYEDNLYQVAKSDAYRYFVSFDGEELVLHEELHVQTMTGGDIAVCDVSYHRCQKYADMPAEKAVGYAASLDFLNEYFR